MTKLCVVDQRPIPAARLELSPRTVTCSPACAAEHKKELNRAANRRYQSRRREQAKAEAGA